MLLGWLLHLFYSVVGLGPLAIVHRARRHYRDHPRHHNGSLPHSARQIQHIALCILQHIPRQLRDALNPHQRRHPPSAPDPCPVQPLASSPNALSRSAPDACSVNPAVKAPVNPLRAVSVEKLSPAGSRRCCLWMSASPAPTSTASHRHKRRRYPACLSAVCRPPMRSPTKHGYPSASALVIFCRKLARYRYCHRCLP